jgi:hypothetical protein
MYSVFRSVIPLKSTFSFVNGIVDFPSSVGSCN